MKWRTIVSTTGSARRPRETSSVRRRSSTSGSGSVVVVVVVDVVVGAAVTVVEVGGSVVVVVVVVPVVAGDVGAVCSFEVHETATTAQSAATTNDVLLTTWEGTGQSCVPNDPPLWLDVLQVRSLLSWLFSTLSTMDPSHPA